jgi:hypothetical protein
LAKEETLAVIVLSAAALAVISAAIAAALAVIRESSTGTHAVLLHLAGMLLLSVSNHKSPMFGDVGADGCA